MNKLKLLLVGALLLVGVESSRGFVMIGPMLATEVAGGGADFNITDDLGGPKELKHFFRWNNPFLTYTFDQSFVRYFGLEGMDAVHDAFRVVNDFFIPADGSYKGVSSMDFARDGYLSNYNTTWVNTTAQNAQIIDIKSLTLGMLVNHLGVGNPHRYAFTVRGISTNVMGTQWSFNVRLKNYDPVTWQPTDVINGVQYSYRLIHDAAPQAGGPITAPTFVDMEEFTTDTSGNAWSAVAGIVDAFYGNTAIYWTDTPTAFNFGVYYDGNNAMGGQYQPRHALTYDDVGALKYMYRTNNLVYEDLPQSINLIEPPQFLRGQAAVANSAPNFLQPTMPNWRGVFPRRSGGAVPSSIPGFATTSPMRGVPIIGSATNPSMMVGQALRGGIDRMQYYYMPLDSLLGTLFTETNFIWTDTFITTNGVGVGGLNVTTPGASAWFGPTAPIYYTQKVGRTVTAPDIIFVCDDLGTALDGVPVAWNRSDNSAGWTNNGSWSNVGLVQLNITNVGPGTIFVPPNGIIYTFSNLGNTATSGSFEVLWTGEASVVGNQTPSFSLWGHIKGPGPQDVITFPRDATVWRLENELAPKVSVPTISMISDNGGATPIATNSFTRTEETISIIGNGLASVTAVEIMFGDKVIQTIFPVERYKLNDLRIDIPPGVLTEQAEGSTRTVRVWNTVGVSLKSPQFFNIYTGRAVVTGTSADNQIFDRAQPLTVYGFGFKSLQTRSADGSAKLSHVRLEDGVGNVISPRNGNATAANWEVVSDTQAVLPLSTFDYQADGPWRRLRIARDDTNNSLSATLSATNNVELINWITTTPQITTIQTVEASGTSTAVTTSNALRRDRALDINGTALNTAIAIEIVRQDGTSFPNPVVINLPNAGVTVDDNGIRIQVSSNVIPYNDADGHTTDQQRKFKVYNVIGNHIYSTAFNVNVQPFVTGHGAFGGDNAFNRHQISGDDVTINGTGLLAVTTIEIVDENGTALTNTPKIVLPHPGVVVTDASIAIDTQTAQFANASSADSEREDRYRRFKLTSERDDVLTSAASRFIIGVPPTHTTLAGIFNTNKDYRRDNDTITFNGTGLLLLSIVQIVDVNGNAFPGVTAATDTTGVDSVTSTSFNLDANATAFTGKGHILDSATYLSNDRGTRRLQIVTPFGFAISPASTGFTISATPDFLPIDSNTAPSTFAGGGYNGGSNTYATSNGNLVINGSNFRGVRKIQLEDNLSNAYITTVVDPSAPPAGITFNSTGTQITITKQYISDNNASWAGSSAVADRRVRLTSAGGQAAFTPNIITTGAPPPFELSGTGYAAPNFQRNGTFVMTANAGEDLSGVISATLVDAAGVDISGVAPILAASLTITATTVEIPIDAFDDDGNEIDALTAIRRVKLTRPTGDLISDVLFTVSSPPDVATAAATLIYAITGAADGGAALGTYDSAVGTGDISLTGLDPTEDMNGVKTIEFFQTTTGAAIIGAPVLTPADWTVSADGKSITIPKANVSVLWATPVVSADRAFRLTTAADAQTVSRTISATSPFHSFTTLGGGYSAPNFQRNDTFVMNAAGEDLSGVISATLVDAAGVDIVGVTAIPVGVNLVISGVGNTVATISADAFDADGNDVDALTAIRRVKLTRPTGDLISDVLFTVSSPPDVVGPLTTVYAAVGGADGGAAGGTYSNAAGNGNVSITTVSGADMRGVSTIDWMDGVSVIGGDTQLTSGDWTVSVDGMSITISKATVDAKGTTWKATGSNRNLRLTTVAGAIVATPNIDTDNPVYASLTGPTAGNFRRDVSALIFTGTDLSRATQVTLVENDGSDIVGLTPLTIGPGVATATATEITVLADQFPANMSDTIIAAGRRVKVILPNMTLLSTGASGAFTVSATPDLTAAFGTVHAAVGGADGGAAGGTYTFSTDNGNLSITAAEADMRGVTDIDWWDVGAGTPVVGATPLVPADWTVSADGRSITITKAVIQAKGSQWYIPNAADRRLRLTTVANQEPITPTIATRATP